VPIAGGTPVTLASGSIRPVAIALDADNAYWLSWRYLLAGLHRSQCLEVRSAAL